MDVNSFQSMQDHMLLFGFDGYTREDMERLLLLVGVDDPVLAKQAVGCIIGFTTAKIGSLSEANTERLLVDCQKATW